MNESIWTTVITNERQSRQFCFHVVRAPLGENPSLLPVGVFRQQFSVFPFRTGLQPCVRSHRFSRPRVMLLWHTFSILLLGYLVSKMALLFLMNATGGGHEIWCPLFTLPRIWHCHLFAFKQWCHMLYCHLYQAQITKEICNKIIPEAG